LTECSLKNEICGGSCTGYEGAKDWKKIDNVVNGIECESCRDEGKKLMSFAHDIVNAKLGKKIFDKKNFQTHAKQIECICKKTGVC